MRFLGWFSLQAGIVSTAPAPALSRVLMQAHTWAALPLKEPQRCTSASVEALSSHTLAGQTGRVRRCLQVRNVFTGLFLASIGLVISPVFILEHIRLLSIGAAVVLLLKASLISLVVWNFGFTWNTAVTVGVSLAQARSCTARGSTFRGTGLLFDGSHTHHTYLLNQLLLGSLTTCPPVAQLGGLRVAQV
jgi:hypothetical protein